MNQLLEIVDLTKSFAVRQGMFARGQRLLAVNGVSMGIAPGESLGLVGESGCGKSTLGKMACGLLEPDSGQILFQNRPLPLATARSWAAGKIQMIFQDPSSSLDPRMTVGASVAEPLAAQKNSRGESLAKARELLRTVGLGGMAERYPHQFSGGQKQRIAIARAIGTKPDLIVCDEPVSALDASVQAQVLNLLKDLQDRFHPAYLFISHDLAVIGFMCSRILVMYLGQIVEEGSREELFARAGHPYTRALIAAMPRGEQLWSTGEGLHRLPPPLYGELPSPLNPPAGCHFHPRCPMAHDICSQKAPPWKNLAPDWRARCFFAGE